MKLKRLRKKIYYKREILKLFLKIFFSKKAEIYFFFTLNPFGGAERVHLTILEVFNKFKTICFITHRFKESIVEKEFSKNTEIIDCSLLHDTRKQRTLNNLVAKKINSSKKPIIFGCNTTLFYEVIPLLKKEVKIIDLLHAFSYEEPNAAEKISIPLVHKIDKRIVLGKKTLLDYKELYKKNTISPSFLDRIHIIPNKIDAPEKYPSKPDNKELKILFVGRNSYEKRPELFFQIANECDKKKMNVTFNVIGDFEKDLNISQNLKITGIVKDRNELNKCYEESDLLLITSSREGFPMVILEGMAQGVVPISTDVGEISSVVNTENKNGFLIKNAKQDELIVKSFIDKISFLEENRVILKEYSKNSYTTVKEHFSEEKNTRAYLKLFFD